MKKNITIVLILAMLFGIRFNIYHTSANIKKVKLKVGTSKNLKMKTDKAKIKWTSKNKSIVKVSSKGKVTGLKKGKTKIIGVSGRKKRVFLVQVKNVYLKVNFDNVSKIQIRNLYSGKDTFIDGSEINKIVVYLNQAKFFKKITRLKKPLIGNKKYALYLYNKNGEEMKDVICIGFDNLSKNNVEYISNPKMKLDIFDQLFREED